MLILHAAWRNGSLAIWGEVSFEAAEAAGPVRRGRRRKGFDVPPPPRCGARLEVLHAALPGASAGIGREARTLIAWLPTAGGKPAPSSALLGEPPHDGSSTIEPWSVEAIEIDSAASLDLLASVAGKRLLAPGVLVGADLAFFATAMRFAAALVARGHVLPAIEQSDAAWRARWIAAPAAGEHEQIAALVRAIPPAALALGSKHDAPPSHDRRTVIETFLGSICDRLMRDGTSAAVPARMASLHDRWMPALSSSDGVVAGDSAEIASLRDTLAEWRRPVAEQSLFDFRLGFRLEEPAEETASWTIRLLLQGISDPSLLLPLSLVWRSDGRGEDATAARRLLGRGRGNAKRFVHGSLAHAAAMSRFIDDALRKSSPSEITTDTTGAFAFLTSDAAALESSGFGVFLPSWWSRKGTRRRLSLHAKVLAPKFKSSSGLSLGELAEVRWAVALGNEELSMAELRALAKMKVPLVRLRGQWVQLRAEEIEEAIRFARAKGETLSAGEIVRMNLSGSAAAKSLEVTAVEATGAVGDLLERLEGKREWEELEPPKGFAGSLRPYQARGYSWLDFLAKAGLGACLADDMGLGKTVQTLALVQRHWRAEKSPVLLICPTSVTGNWVREAARFTPGLPVLLHHGADRMRGKEFLRNAKKSAMVISSYALLTRDADLLRTAEWKGVVLDEAQNVKNSETRQAKAARSSRTTSTSCSRLPITAAARTSFSHALAARTWGAPAPGTNADPACACDAKRSTVAATFTTTSRTSASRLIWSMHHRSCCGRTSSCGPSFPPMSGRRSPSTCSRRRRRTPTSSMPSPFTSTA